jgi:outer membrane biosynthesis protein TonB
MLRRFLLILSISFLPGVFQNASAQKKTVEQSKKPIINAMASYLPKPEYSQEAKDLCASGKVEVEIEVVFTANEGKVVSAKAVSGDELLRKPTEEAVLKAKFSPINDANLEKFSGIIVYNFVPEKKCFDAGIVNKKAIYLPKPLYSPDIKASGTVEVRIVIDQSGNVISAKAVSGHLLLRPFAESAARKARFNPTNDVGKIRIKAVLVYDFKSKS